MSYFSVIDTEEKAYFLGLFASSGNFSKPDKISLYVNNIDFLYSLKNLISEKSYFDYINNFCFGLTVEHKETCDDVCSHLGIEQGKHLLGLKMPQFSVDGLEKHFIRGLFDGHGEITNSFNTPKCSIQINPSSKLAEALVRLSPSICYVGSNNIFWSHEAVLDFLDWLYNDSDTKLRHKKNYYEYLQLCCYITNITPNKNNKINEDFSLKWVKSRDDAVGPFKVRASDSGYDLTLIDIFKSKGNFVMFETGIAIEPPYGWYFDMVPRSSLAKTGWILANCVGVIDRTYRGTVKVPLLKVVPDADDLELPDRFVQLIPRPVVHMKSVEVKKLTDTDRNNGGFGSTNNSGLK